MKWTKTTFLGEGEYGTVFLAKVDHSSHENNTTKLPFLIAVKSSPLTKSTSLRNEKEILNMFQECSYIINCFGDEITKENEEEQFYNIFLEYARFGSLSDHIRKSCKNNKGLDECVVKKHTKSIILGLSCMHKKGYVHCDIKPGNILLFGSRKKGIVSEIAKLADFGLAKKASIEVSSHERFSGTPMYAGPETVRNDEFGPFSDIWALGCVVLEMITGRPPWKRNSNNGDLDYWNVIHTICFTDEMPQIPSWVSEEARDFLNKCLVRDYNLRWTADMLLDHPFVTSLGTDSTAQGI